jgi:hypothetical protein
MEDVIFTTTIPIPKSNGLQIRDMKKTTMHDAIHDSMHDAIHDSIQITKLLQILRGEMSREEILSKLELKNRDNLRRVYLKPALESGFIELTLPGKLRSKKQKYRITEKGKIFLKSRIKQHE